MEFVILGSTELRVDGDAVPLGTAKQRGMLSVLLYHVGEPVRAEVLVEYLWGGRGGDTHRSTLYSLASRIRAVLHRVGIDDALVRLPRIGAYRLNIDRDLIDYFRFRRIVNDAREATRRSDHAAASTLLSGGISLWRDEPLADLRGAAAEHLRGHLKGELLDAHKLLADCLLKMDEPGLALDLLAPLVRDHELDEVLAQHWIAALCATDRHDQARTYFVAFRDRFRRKMHLEPGVTMPVRVTAAASKPFTPPRQLPADIADFTGHEALLDQLDALIDTGVHRAKVVVITGMPGVGKTTLAIHWAHRRRHRFADGDLYLNLRGYGPASVIEPDDALGRLLRALDVPADRIPPDGEQRRERLNRLLDGRRLLLILDNVGDADQVRPLIPASATCVTVITSRNRLTGLTIREAIRNLTVPPLTDDEALALLDHVVSPLRTRTEPEAMRALARISGGLPLALRIVGEHVAERPKARIADLLDDLSNHLLDGAEPGDETSLHTVFDWSLNALRPQAARLFRILGLHPGESISIPAAAAMSNVDLPLVEQLMNGLARGHLINHDTARRYRFHDLLRRYAADRAYRDEPAGTISNAMRRLLDWALLSAVNAAAVLAPHSPPVPDLPDPPDVTPDALATETEAMAWAEAERDNLSALARWAADHGLHRYAWQLVGTIHEILDRYGRQDVLLELNELALRSARIDGHREGESGTLNNLGVTYFDIHDYDQATARFEAALALARDAGYPEAELACCHNLAALQVRAGNTDAAIELCQHVLQIARETGNAEGESAALHRLGQAYRQLGRYDDAQHNYWHALIIRERIGALRPQAATHAELAAMMLEGGEPEPAYQHCMRALDIHERTRDDAARCDALTLMADIRCALRDPVAAVRDGRQALAISRRLGDSLRQARTLTVLADALAAAGEGDAAETVCHDALELMDELSGPDVAPMRDRAVTIRSLLRRPLGS